MVEKDKNLLHETSITLIVPEEENIDKTSL